MENAWEDLKELATTLVARRERPLHAARVASRGARSAEWFLARADVRSSADEPIRARFERPVGDIPARLKTAMMECQKPFQLWNVTRVADAAPLAFAAEPPYKVGGAAASAADRTFQPGHVKPASALLHAAREEVALVRADAFGARRRLGRLLAEGAEEQGLGLPDEG